MSQEIKLLFCSSPIIPEICPFRESIPKVCCCTCPLKLECHTKQAEMAKESGDYSKVLPCVRLDKEDERDYCNDCDFLT
tara:strand:+ start:48 stop:284 length:237 start_codon:yes stop_codon:yes gene_type:complete